MKKKISVVLLVVLCVALCTVFTACAGQTKIDGVWAVSSVTDPNGNTVEGDQITETLGEITYEFQANGVLIASIAGQNAEGTWTQDGDKVTVEANDGTGGTGTVKGNTLTLESNGSSMVFTKK